MANDSSRFSSPAIFGVLLAVSFTVPWALQAVFPPGEGDAGRSRAKEEPALKTDAALSEEAQRRQMAANFDWLGDKNAAVAFGKTYGGGKTPEPGAVLEEKPSEEVPAAPEEARPEGAVPDLSPGLLAEYDRSWDTLDTVRERFTAGGFVYVGSDTRIQVLGHELRFTDDFDSLKARGGELDIAHRLNSRWMAEAGAGFRRYEGLRTTGHGFGRGSYSGDRTFASLTASREDLWERLPALRDGVAVTSISPFVFQRLVDRLWAAGSYSYGGYNDDNIRQSLSGEAGYDLSSRYGLSLSGGIETYHFRLARDTYWSPDYYRLIFGRLRLARGFDETPFPYERPWPMDWHRRWSYLAEVLAGVNDNDDYEQSFRAGLGWAAARRWTLKAEIHHLDSNGRFAEDYHENRVQGRVVVTF